MLLVKSVDPPSRYLALALNAGAIGLRSSLQIYRKVHCVVTPTIQKRASKGMIIIVVS